MDTREELIGIVVKIFNEGKIPCWGTPEEIADAILDKLPELVEIDENIMAKIIGDWLSVSKQAHLSLLDAICQAKGIIKVKEGK